MEPFRTRDLDESIDFFLLNENSVDFNCGTIQKPANKIIFNLRSPDDVEKIFGARILFIASENFAEWASFLMEQRTIHLQSNIKVFISSSCDLTFLNEHFYIFHRYFPEAEFWIQNWCGDLPYVKSLPIGVLTYFPVSVNRTELFFISFVTLNSTERMKYKDFVYAYPAIQKYMCDFLADEAYSKKMSSYYFTFCPQGNGYDSYRLWEALAHGTVPILLETPFTVSLLKQYPRLPLIILKEYIDLFRLIPNLSKELYESIMLNRDVSPMYKNYWISKYQFK
jgi:hypothetical protein